jgi:hypothetical protein
VVVGGVVVVVVVVLVVVVVVVVEEEEEVEEEGVEVEEWMYKGLLFFKDTNNLVYTNNNGEPGDPIGTYDPVKNTLKKLKPT